MKKGINFFDVSPFYGLTRAETVLGKALRELPRDSYVLSTKVGRYGEDKFDFSAKRVISSIEESMQRLSVDHFDIVHCHDIEFGDLDQVVTETIPALNKLKEAGKLRAVGISGYPLEAFPYVISCANPGAVNCVLSYCHYNLLNERLSLLSPGLRRMGIGVINASPMAMGLLTPSGAPDWHPADDETKDACRAAQAFCEENGESLPNIAMKFALGAPPQFVSSTLVGIESVETLNKNIASTEQDLDSPIIEQVRDILKPVLNRRWKSGRFDA